MKKLSLVTQSMSAGNFDFKLPLIKSNDEVGKLNNSFMLMQNELQNYQIRR